MHLRKSTIIKAILCNPIQFYLQISFFETFFESEVHEVWEENAQGTQATTDQDRRHPW